MADSTPTQDDLDRAQERIEAKREDYPALAEMWEAKPDGYDPQEAITEREESR